MSDSDLYKLILVVLCRWSESFVKAERIVYLRIKPRRECRVPTHILQARNPRALRALFDLSAGSQLNDSALSTPVTEATR